MWDDPGLAREILEIRPPCLEAKVPNEVEVFFTQYGGSSGSANLVLLHKDTLLKNIMLEPNQQFVRFELEVQSTGVINVVVMPEETDADVQISSVAPLPVLPSTAAQELQKVFENTVDAAKAIVVRKESVPVAGEQQYLLVEGHKLSEGQEQAIRHMLWKERFRPFAADLDFLLNTPTTDAPATPSFMEDSTEESEARKTLSSEFHDLEKTDSQGERWGDTDTAGDEQGDSGISKQQFWSVDDPQGSQVMATESYGEVLKGMLKFLSSCDAWSCFFYVVKECNNQGVLFTGIDQSGLSEVGIQGLYELAPQSAEGLGDIGDSDAFCANVEELFRGAGPEPLTHEDSGFSESISFDLDTAPQRDHHLPLNTLPAGHRKSGDSETESVLVGDSLISETSSVGDQEGHPLASERGGSCYLGGTSKRNEAEVEAQGSSGTCPSDLKRAVVHSGESQAAARPSHTWHAPSKMILLKSSSMPVMNRDTASPPPLEAVGFSYADLKDAKKEMIRSRGVWASWPGTLLLNPANSSDAQLGVAQYFFGIDSVSFSTRLAMVLICSWLLLIGGSSDADLNVGFFCLGVAGLLVGVPMFGRLLVRCQGLVVLMSRMAVLLVFVLHAAEMLDCPCMPSWMREGRCLGGILQSVIWLAFLSLGFKGHLWRHFLFLALESGAFLVAVSRSDDRCHSNLWLVAGPALLGEIYSITSVAWQRQRLFGGQDVTTAKKVA